MTALTDRIAAVLEAHRPYGLDCKCGTAINSDAWWAVHVAAAVEATLGEHPVEVWGVVSPNDNDVQDCGPDRPTAEDECEYLHEEGLDTAKLVHRWEFAWSEVER